MNIVPKKLLTRCQLINWKTIFQLVVKNENKSDPISKEKEKVMIM